MDEQKQAQEFNALLDSILAGDDISLDSSELSETVKLASYLYDLDLAVNTFALQHDLRERLTTQNKEKILMKRKKLLIGVTLLIAIGLFILIPVRTYAQSILRRIGGITFTTQEPFPKEEQEAAATIMAERLASATALAEQAADNESAGEAITPDPTAESTSNSNEAAVPTLSNIYPVAPPYPILNEDEIQNLAGFPGWRPKFVPEGYTLNAHFVILDNFGNPIVRTFYGQENKPVFGNIMIDQFKTFADPRGIIGNWKIGDVPVSNVIVNGEMAVFAEKAHIIPPPGANILVWATNKYTFTMIGEDLSQETMIAIAESMQVP